MFALVNQKANKNLAISQNFANVLKLYQQSIATNAERLKKCEKQKK